MASSQEVTRHLLGGGRGRSPSFWLLVGVLTVLFGAGVVGLIIRLQGGFHERSVWGYYAATVAYLLTITQGAPLVAVALRLTKADWRRPVTRAAELFTVVGVLNFFLFLPLLALVPSAQGRSTVWLQWPWGAPHVWDTLAWALLVLCGLALLYTSVLPDVAAARDGATGFRQRVSAWLASHWQGTERQWRVQRGGLVLLGVFYLMLFVLVHTLFSSDFAMSIVPGWKDAIFPPFHALSGLQSAVAVTVVAMYLWRRAEGQPYLGRDQFWALSKVLFALSLLWFYFWFAQFLTMWYGRLPIEQTLLQLLMVGPYRVPFVLAFSLNFLVPFFILLWNPARKSILGPTLAATSILVGTLFDRIRIYVSAYSVEESAAHILEQVPATRLPDGVDILMVVGLVAGAVLFYVLAARLIPPIAIWEVKEGLYLRVERLFLRKGVSVVGKPE